MWNPFRKNIGKKIAETHVGARVHPRPRVTVTRSVKDPTSDDILKKWKARATPYVAYTDLYQTKLVGRARDVCINNRYGKAGLRVLRQNIVGENGIRLQSAVQGRDGKLDTDINTAIEMEWREFSKKGNVDVAGKNNLLALQSLALNSMVMDGEFFFRKHKQGTYGIQLQAVDALRIPPSATNRYRTNNKAQIYKNGIIFDKETDKPLYYLLNREKVNYYDLQPDRNSNHIPAGDILHGFQQDAMGQVRGTPLGQTASETLYMIAKYSEAALVNAQVGAGKIGFFTQESDQPLPTTYKLDDQGDPMRDEDGNLIVVNAMDGAKIDMTPGSMSSLPPGTKVETWDPEYPNTEFRSFIQIMLQGAAVGFSVPYADISGDLSDVNYSSMRQGALEIRANYRILQGLLIEELMDPVYLEWLIAVLMDERIRVDGTTLTIDMLPMLHKPIWTPKRWAWIDPRSEAIANQIAIKSGLKSPSQIIKEMGGDPEEVWQSIKQDIETMEGMGLPKEYVYGILAHQQASVDELIEEVYASGTGQTINDMSNQQ